MNLPNVCTTAVNYKVIVASGRACLRTIDQRFLDGLAQRLKNSSYDQIIQELVRIFSPFLRSKLSGNSRQKLIKTIAEKLIAYQNVAAKNVQNVMNDIGRILILRLYYELHHLVNTGKMKEAEFQGKAKALEKYGIFATNASSLREKSGNMLRRALRSARNRGIGVFGRGLSFLGITGLTIKAESKVVVASQGQIREVVVDGKKIGWIKYYQKNSFTLSLGKDCSESLTFTGPYSAFFNTDKPMGLYAKQGVVGNYSLERNYRAIVVVSADGQTISFRDIRSFVRMNKGKIEVHAQRLLKFWQDIRQNKLSVFQGISLLENGQSLFQKYKGENAQRRLLLIFNDGRAAVLNVSNPVSLKSLGYLVQKLGAQRAINLDTGGSNYCQIDDKNCGDYKAGHVPVIRRICVE